ncbi:MAG: laccase domain-containing protein, partial [Acidobacteriota bacterium]
MQETIHHSPGHEEFPKGVNTFMSHASIGGIRRVVGADEDPSPRFTAAGNMSEGYAQPDMPELARPVAGMQDEYAEERRRYANENVNEFVRSVGYEPRQVVILRPTNPRTGTEPLGIQNADEVFMPGQSGDMATWLPEDYAGDFIYTRNPYVVLGCRPADCPVIVFEGTDADSNDMEAMLHAGWQNLNAGHLEKSLVFLESQGVTRDTLRIVVGAGASKESFPYSNKIRPGDEGSRFNHPDQDR